MNDQEYDLMIFYEEIIRRLMDLFSDKGINFDDILNGIDLGYDDKKRFKKFILGIKND